MIRWQIRKMLTLQTSYFIRFHDMSVLDQAQAHAMSDRVVAVIRAHDTLLHEHVRAIEYALI